MDAVDQWKYILVRKRKRKQLPLDIDHCSPITLRNIILDVHTPSAVLDQIAQVYSDDEYLLKDLVRCPNLDETTLAFIALTASDEVKSFISGTRVLDLVVVDEPTTAVAVPGKGKAGETPGKKQLNVIQASRIRWHQDSERLIDLLNMGQDLVQPVRASALLQAQMAVLGNLLQEGDQHPGVGLQDLRLQLPATRADHRSVRGVITANPSAAASTWGLVNELYR